MSFSDSYAGIVIWSWQVVTRALGVWCVCVWYAGLGSIQFRNWNCSSIPIPIPELELELELKMELELKSLELELELELKTRIEFFAIATTALTIVNQPFPNSSFNRGGHNLSCDWLLMQQVCLFKFLGHCPPVVWSLKDHGRVPCTPWIDRGQRD